jgi:hypothetical protein
MKTCFHQFNHCSHLLAIPLIEMIVLAFVRVCFSSSSFRCQIIVMVKVMESSQKLSLDDIQNHVGGSLQCHMDACLLRWWSIALHPIRPDVFEPTFHQRTCFQACFFNLSKSNKLGITILGNGVIRLRNNHSNQINEVTPKPLPECIHVLENHQIIFIHRREACANPKPGRKVSLGLSESQHDLNSSLRIAFYWTTPKNIEASPSEFRSCLSEVREKNVARLAPNGNNRQQNFTMLVSSAFVIPPLA